MDAGLPPKSLGDDLIKPLTLAHFYFKPNTRQMRFDPDGVQQYPWFRTRNAVRWILHALLGLGLVRQHGRAMVPRFERFTTI